jgi:hypothetical protein
VSEIHQLIIAHGRERARQLVPAEDRPLVDAAAAVLADESRRMGITYSGFCLTALPHKRIPEDQSWKRVGHKVTLVVEPGRLEIGGVERRFGVPFGSRARLVLLYLQTQALRSGSREVPLGGSMRSWMKSMNVSTGGQSYRDLKEQCNRLSACNLKFYWGESQKPQKWAKDSIITGGLIFGEAGDDRQGSFWEDRVVLSQSFFDALKEHPVPVLEAAIREISNKSMAIDLYIWLSYRLHSLADPVRISFAALYSQFGAGYDKLKHFKAHFPDALKYAMNVYPEARVDIEDDGLILWPSRPPVAADRKTAALMGY